MRNCIQKFVILSLFFSVMPVLIQAQDEPSQEEIAINLAEEQLIAYNQGDIESFLDQYSDDVKVYRYPDKLLYEGKENMRTRYAKMFEELPDLHCNLLNRISQGNVVIDHEEVTTEKGKPPFYAIAVYTIKDGKIAEVRFLQ